MKKKALLYEKLKNNAVGCGLCSHRCRIAESKYGICRVRQNIGGELYTYAYGEVIASHIDPIEKKPLYHFFPGSMAYSIAAAGCNFSCSFCQNWQISQAPKAGDAPGGYELKPEEVVREAKKNKCRSISYTYTEPTIFFEYALDTARLAKGEGIYNNFVTNGFMTTEAIDLIRPYLDAANIDLKFFNDDTYKRICGGGLEPVLGSIRHMKEAGIWIEVTTLIVPGLNDSDKELTNIAGFISGVGADIPWHISRFHPDYKYTDTPPTDIETLNRAREIGEKAGLYYIYLGNVAEDADTHCRGCGGLLIARSYMRTGSLRLDGNNCPKCKRALEGIFT